MNPRRAIEDSTWDRWGRSSSVIRRVPAPSPVDDGRLGDPHGVERALARLGSRSRGSASVPFLIAVALLDDDEMADCLAPGRFEGAGGVAVLTTRRLLLVNARQWSPAMVQFPVDEELEVMGWEERSAAALVLQHGKHHAVIDGVDRPKLMRWPAGCEPDAAARSNS